MRDTWALDVTDGVEVARWVPVDLDTGDIVFGLTVAAERPPREAVAIVSQEGQDHVEEILEQHGDAIHRIMATAKDGRSKLDG